jgi:hypothetical protein
MSNPDRGQFEFTARTGQLIRRCLRGCKYYDDLIVPDYPLAWDRTLPFVAFAHRPHDARSSCIAFLPESRSPHAQLTGLRELGVPLAFLIGDNTWEMWSLRNDGPRRERPIPARDVEKFFDAHKSEFAPGAIFRAKSWKRVGECQQLEFVDGNLLPLLERDAGGRLCGLFERMVATTMDFLDWKSVPNDDDEARWLTKANFWLLAAKLLHDKRVPRFINLDLHDVRTVFARVATHYSRDNPNPPKINGRLRALQEAARLVVTPPQFQNISAETLGVLYEEALISPTTRKLLGTHRTPTYLVDYMLARLGGWIGELGHKRCHVFEPACGHAPFLSGALRLVSDMLPASVAEDQKTRHDFIKDHLRGCDSDDFALEIARLSLTLADIPNENGWVLNHGDMFAGSTLADETKAATLVLANPPFEREKAAKYFQRTVSALQPGTVFGFVLPVNELTGAASAVTRKQLLADCEIKEISVFPDRMFKFASVETGIVLGRKREAKRTAIAAGIRFRRVRESKMADFRDRYDDSWRDMVDAEWLATVNEARLIVPEFRNIWSACESLPRFKQFAEIGQGLVHRSKADPRFPKGAVTESRGKLAGLESGFASIDDSPNTHLLPTGWWLNLDSRTIRRPLAGAEKGTPQVVLNYAPVDRDVWRLKAFIDSVGRPATSRLLLVRPKLSRLPLTCLWAFANSPIANAHTFAHGSKRDVTTGLLRAMPLPDLNACDLLQLDTATNAYLKTAAEFTATLETATANPESGRAVKRSAGNASSKQLALGLPGQHTDEEIAAAKERLRSLHWRVDAEVLKLYALPPELERELLDAFDGVPRVGVPFEQTRYIPREFREALTLDDFLRITDEWEQTDDRRCQLVEKKFRGGGRTAEEDAEFANLQMLFDLRRKYRCWERTGDANHPLIDESLLRRLQEEDAQLATRK